jgi:MmyB-like transcription regulator ligand binding domain/Helix-turn-helix domain
VPTYRRQELAAFLRSRRARISPDEAGVPPGPGRRTPGLRREEVALLSGVGLTWYTWLEQGRPINASVQRLDRAERAHLYRLAEIPSAPEPAADTLGPEVQEILDTLTPLPACVLNQRFDVLAWNTPYSVIWRRTLAAPVAERNVLWQCFMMPECCGPFAVGRSAELRQLVATFRAAYGRHVGDPSWEDLIARLSAGSAEFAEMWAAQEVQAPSTRVKVYRHATAGDFGLAVTGFDLADLRMTVYTPADGESRRRIGWLLAHPDAPPADHTH